MRYLWIILIPFLIGAAPLYTGTDGVQDDIEAVKTVESVDKATNVFYVEAGSFSVKIVVTTKNIEITGSAEKTYKTLNGLKNFLALQDNAVKVDKINLKTGGYKYTHYVKDSVGDIYEAEERYTDIKDLFNDLYADVLDYY